MALFKHLLFALTIFGTIFSLSSCQSDRSSYMTEQQRQRIRSSYDSLQNTYDSLMAAYNSGSDTMPDELRGLYGEMRNMHRQMKRRHRGMMRGKMGQHMKGKGMQDKGMMGKGMQGKEKHGNMLGRMAGEWYQQMMSMHDRMAEMHRNRGQEKMARMNRRLTRQFRGIMKQTPHSTESGNETSENGEPSNLASLDGATLFNRHCASCHGSQGEGMAGAFPPVVNTKWITAKKSIPIRIVLHGLSGEVKVNNRTYRGNMPAFGARLSSSETAAILNHLRSLSDKNVSKITESDVQKISQKYSDRNQPWSAGELK